MWNWKLEEAYFRERKRKRGLSIISSVLFS